MPFDLRHHRYLPYRAKPDGLVKLVDGIENRLRSLLKVYS